jgi:hypothetical protein
VAQETAKAAELSARVDRDKLQLRLERASTRGSATDECAEKEAAADEEVAADEGLVEGYLRTIHALETETQRLRAHIRALTGPTAGVAGLMVTGEDEEGECEDGDAEGADEGVGYTAVDDDTTAEERQVWSGLLLLSAWTTHLPYAAEGCWACGSLMTAVGGTLSLSRLRSDHAYTYSA